MEVRSVGPSRPRPRVVILRVDRGHLHHSHWRNLLNVQGPGPSSPLDLGIRISVGWPPKTLILLHNRMDQNCKLIFLGYLFYAKNESKNFPCINSFNLQSYKLVRSVSQPYEASGPGTPGHLYVLIWGGGVTPFGEVEWSACTEPPQSDSAFIPSGLSTHEQLEQG